MKAHWTIYKNHARAYSKVTGLPQPCQTPNQIQSKPIEFQRKQTKQISANPSQNNINPLDITFQNKFTYVTCYFLFYFIMLLINKNLFIFDNCENELSYKKHQI